MIVYQAGLTLIFPFSVYKWVWVWVRGQKIRMAADSSYTWLTIVAISELH